MAASDMSEVARKSEICCEVKGFGPPSFTLRSKVPPMRILLFVISVEDEDEDEELLKPMQAAMEPPGKAPSVAFSGKGVLYFAHS